MHERDDEHRRAAARAHAGAGAASTAAVTAAAAAGIGTEAKASTILVNGRPHAWRAGLTVADLIADDPCAVSTAFNGEFLARPARAATAVAPGDALLVFAAVVGG